MQKSKDFNKWFKKLSLRSLQKIKTILEITLSELEIIGIKADKKEYNIVNRVYNQENFSLIEAKNVIESLKRELSIGIDIANSKGLPEITLVIEDKEIIKQLKEVVSGVLLTISTTKSLKNTLKSKAR